MCPHRICDPPERMSLLQLWSVLSLASLARGKVSSGCAHSGPELVYVQGFGGTGWRCRDFYQWREWCSFRLGLWGAVKCLFFLGH